MLESEGWKVSPSVRRGSARPSARALTSPAGASPAPASLRPRPPHPLHQLMAALGGCGQHWCGHRLRAVASLSLLLCLGGQRLCAVRAPKGLIAVCWPPALCSAYKHKL